MTNRSTCPSFEEFIDAVQAASDVPTEAPTGQQDVTKLTPNVLQSDDALDPQNIRDQKQKWYDEQIKKMNTSNTTTNDFTRDFGSTENKSALSRILGKTPDATELQVEQQPEEEKEPESFQSLEESVADAITKKVEDRTAVEDDLGADLKTDLGLEELRGYGQENSGDDQLDTDSL